MDYRKPLDRPIFCVSLHDARGRPIEAPQVLHLHRSRSHSACAELNRHSVPREGLAACDLHVVPTKKQK